MNKAFVAGVVLGGSATFACAQDTGQVRHAGNGDAPGGHGIAVFTGQPEARHGAKAAAGPGADWSTATTPRRAHGRGEVLGPSAGEGGIVLGRQYNLEYLTRADVGDPFHTGTAGKASNLVNPSGTLADSGVRYYSRQMDHISTGASWTADTPGGNAMADRAWGMTVGVDYGPLSLRAAHQNRHVAQVQLYNLAGNNMDAKNSIVAANLRTRWGTAYAAYAANRGWGSSPLYNPDNPYGAGVASTASTDSRDTIAGIAVPMTRSTTFLASFIHKNDRDLANRDANQFALGASYVVSRKTDFYAALSHTLNTNGTGIPIGGAARPSGSSAVNVGMRHAF
jgi:predicted porin